MEKVEGTNVYQTVEPILAGYGDYRIAVRKKKGELEEKAGKVTEIWSYTADRPSIYRKENPKFENSSYYTYGQYWTEQGTKIDVAFYGSSSFELRGIATLNYIDKDNNEKSVSVSEMNYLSGRYTGTLTIPNDAQKLVDIVYRIENVNVPEYIYAEETQSVSNYFIKNKAVFTGIPESYKGATLIILKKYHNYFYSWYSKELDGSGAHTVYGLQEGEYQWKLEGKSMELGSGEFQVSEKTGQTIEFAVTVREIADVEIDIDGELDNTSVLYRLKTGESDADFISGSLNIKDGKAYMKQIPIKYIDGTTPSTIELFAKSTNWYDEGYVELEGDGVNENGVLHYEVKANDNRISASVRRIKTKTVSGKIKNKLGMPIRSGILGRMKQKRELGWKEADGSFSDSKVDWKSSYSNESGEYSVSGVWDGVKAEVEFEDWYYSWSGSYKDYTTTLYEDQNVLDAILEFDKGGIVEVKLALQGLNEKEEMEGDGRLLGRPSMVTKGTSLEDEYIWVNNEEDKIIINTGAVAAGDTLTFWYSKGSYNTVEGANISIYPTED